MTPWQATQSLVDQLQAANIRATADVRSLHPPGVLVEWASHEITTGCASLVSWRCLLVGPAGPNADAWTALDGLHSSVMAQLAYQATGRPVAWTQPTTGETLLAIELDYSAHIDWEG